MCCVTRGKEGRREGWREGGREGREVGEVGEGGDGREGGRGREGREGGREEGGWMEGGREGWVDDCDTYSNICMFNSNPMAPRYLNNNHVTE